MRHLPDLKLKYTKFSQESLKGQVIVQNSWMVRNKTQFETSDMYLGLVAQNKNNSFINLIVRPLIIYITQLPVVLVGLQKIS